MELRKRYLDNRDMRDNNYEGPLVIETKSKNVGINKEGALRVMNSILVKDKEDFEYKVKKAKMQIEHYEMQINLIDKRLKEFDL